MNVHDSRNRFQRIRTGLYSLDWLLGNKDEPGFPVRIMVEVFGNPSIGKSTLSYYLASCINKDATVVLADLEGGGDAEHITRNMIRSGFDGDVIILDDIDKDGKPIAHSLILTRLADSLADKDVSAGILDSIGAYAARAEENTDDVGQTIMGRRAMDMSKFSRRAVQKILVSPNPTVMFLLNHAHDAISGYGVVTPGGKTKSFLSSVRIHLTQKESRDDGCMLVKVRAIKKRKGGKNKDKEGLVFIIPDYGVSPQMTWVYDCLYAGLATRKAGYVRIGDTNFGRIGEIIDKARMDDLEFFEPFKVQLELHEEELYATS